MSAMLRLSQVLPVPGPVWGPCPLRPPGNLAPHWRGVVACSARLACRRVARLAVARSAAWQAIDAAGFDAGLRKLRSALRRDGLVPRLVAEALAAGIAAAAGTLGQTPRLTQLMAAAVLIDNRMAEMATGEGKTLAIGLAAAVAGLAGIPVHVVTANSYLGAA